MQQKYSVELSTQHVVNPHNLADAIRLLATQAKICDIKNKHPQILENKQMDEFLLAGLAKIAVNKRLEAKWGVKHSDQANNFSNEKQAERKMVEFAIDMQLQEGAVITEETIDKIIQAAANGNDWLPEGLNEEKFMAMTEKFAMDHTHTDLMNYREDTAYVEATKSLITPKTMAIARVRGKGMDFFRTKNPVGRSTDITEHLMKTEEASKKVQIDTQLRQFDEQLKQYQKQMGNQGPTSYN
ncbi:MAG: hypothetical protein FWD89_04340 [Firmicutes bacterium]|nr:hypothetical protein [Bacillota bacterium]